MLDIETLGTNNKSPILSIGACEFDFETGVKSKNTFHTKIDVACYDNLKQAFEMDYGTLKWWSKQSNFQNVMNGQVTLHEALLALKVWFEQFDVNKVQVWSQGPDFDFPITKHAFGVFKMAIPWKYYNQRDTRTLYSIAPGFKRSVHEGTMHDALEDCIHQVSEACQAFKLIHQKT